MTLSPNTQITQENFGLTAKGECEKCGYPSGDDWSQCGGSCPVPGSPHFRPALSPPAEGERYVIVPLSRAPYPASFLDAVNGYATGGSGRCLEAIQAEGARIESTPTPAPVDWERVGPKLVSELRNAVSTMVEQRTRFRRYGKSHAEIDVAIDEAEQALAAAQPEDRT